MEHGLTGTIRPARSVLGGMSTAGPGRGKALGRARGGIRQAAAKPRLARLLQTAAAWRIPPRISESETAFTVLDGQQSARATQHRPCCTATGWTWTPRTAVQSNRTPAA